jgi:glutamyl-tRNA synthetase
VGRGPVLQSARTQEYLAAADELLAVGHAYECFCTEDEVKARNERRAAGRPPGTTATAATSPPSNGVDGGEGRRASIRFRTPDDGVSHFVDAIRGDVRVEWSTDVRLRDRALRRQPDLLPRQRGRRPRMDITHVIRGEDLLDSTHRVLALRDGVGREDRPVYAHLPLILGPDRAKLSKRHGAVAIEEFRDAGYLPEALVNYLALLGWAPEDGREVMDADELVAAFDLDRVTHAAAAFDHAKLDWDERRVDPPAHASSGRGARHADRAHAVGESFDVDLFHEAMRLGQERAVTLADMVAQSEFLFVVRRVPIPRTCGSESRHRSDRRGARRADPVLERASGTSTPSGDEASHARLGMSKTQMNKKTMPSLYAVIEGRPSGFRSSTRSCCSVGNVRWPGCERLASG